jgi:hypothetical protein
LGGRGNRVLPGFSDSGVSQVIGNDSVAPTVTSWDGSHIRLGVIDGVYTTPWEVNGDPSEASMTDSITDSRLD